MLYVDDTALKRSSVSLAKKMTVFVEVCRIFSSNMSEKKAGETMCVRVPPYKGLLVEMVAQSQQFGQKYLPACLGKSVDERCR